MLQGAATASNKTPEPVSQDARTSVPATADPRAESVFGRYASETPRRVQPGLNAGAMPAGNRAKFQVFKHYASNTPSRTPRALEQSPAARSPYKTISTIERSGANPKKCSLPATHYRGNGNNNDDDDDDIMATATPQLMLLLPSRKHQLKLQQQQ